MEYKLSQKYASLMPKIMGPNPMKLAEELMLENRTAPGSLVMDLGSGTGLTSVFFAKEYGFKVYAADLWSDPEENKVFFNEMGAGDVVTPVKADATDLPFEKEFFDGVVSVDSYNYFGRDPEYLDKKLLPCVKRGGYVYIAVPGMKKDCHENLPRELLLSWTPEQMAYMRGTNYWADIMSKSRDARIISLREMDTNDEAWNDWLKCENEYAVNDRKSMLAGGGKYLNFIAIVMKKD